VIQAEAERPLSQAHRAVCRRSHFAAHEEPEALAHDIAEFFRTFRS